MPWKRITFGHKRNAKLMLPVPKECETKNCDAVLRFAVFGANPQRPVSVVFDSADQGWQWTEKIVASSGDAIEVRVPLARRKGQAKPINLHSRCDITTGVDRIP